MLQKELSLTDELELELQPFIKHNVRPLLFSEPHCSTIVPQLATKSELFDKNRYSKHQRGLNLEKLAADDIKMDI